MGGPRPPDREPLGRKQNWDQPGGKGSGEEGGAGARRRGEWPEGALPHPAGLGVVTEQD